MLTLRLFPCISLSSPLPHQQPTNGSKCGGEKQNQQQQQQRPKRQGQRGGRKPEANGEGAWEALRGVARLMCHDKKKKKYLERKKKGTKHRRLCQVRKRRGHSARGRGTRDGKGAAQQPRQHKRKKKSKRKKNSACVTEQHPPLKATAPRVEEKKRGGGKKKGRKEERPNTDSKGRTGTSVLQHSLATASRQPHLSPSSTLPRPFPLPLSHLSAISDACDSRADFCRRARVHAPPRTHSLQMEAETETTAAAAAAVAAAVVVAESG